EADGARGRRHGAVARHAGNGVDLEEPGAPARSDFMMDAAGRPLLLVMPGMVLISRSRGRPAASIMKSDRPQPEAPAASKAASARLARCASALAERPEGQK